MFRNACFNVVLIRRYTVTVNYISRLNGTNSSQHSSSADDVRQDSDGLYPGHIPTNLFQKVLLSVGFSALALTCPWRRDVIATLGETTGYPGLLWMRKKMEADSVGRLILKERPVINTRTVDLDYLQSLPHGTFGREYADWLHVNQASPDERLPVHFVDDVELAYVMRRYREIHDLMHVMLGQPTNMLGEVTVKAFEGIQTGLFMCASGGTLGIVRLGRRHREMYWKTHFSWAVRNAFRARNVMTVYFEKHWELPIEQLRSELNIESPPYTPLRKNFDR